MNGTVRPENSNMYIDKTLAQVLERLETLETQLAYQEHWLDSLNETITQQHKALERLERLNELMQQKIREQRDSLSQQDDVQWHPQDDVPPHY
ncbi:SlyX family protein [Phytohalomonas tamaricis]|uniref:SlyX family protein n=1 Tax=Phytohalomonas tamaricis TaxID=2081032 RepID=UPI0021D415AA|nr:SlyX family protein [Phytohalomonas tamaricis]